MRVGLIFATLATAGILAGCSSSGSSGSLASIDVGGPGPDGGGTGGGGTGGDGGSGGGGGGSNGAEGSVVAATRTYSGSIATSTYGQPTGRNATGGVLAFLREETNGTSITGSPQEVALLEGESGGAIPQEGAGDFSRMEVAPAIGSPARVLQPQGGERTTYVEISSTGDTNQLSYVDYDYVRAGTAQVLPLGNGVGQETAFYGAKDPSVARPTTMNGTATYVGGLGATVFSGGERNAMTGRTTLNADFDNATITGKVDGILLTTGNGGGAAGSSYELLMENGSIAGADYNGTVRAVDIDTGATVIDSAAGRSTFNGGFYGPGAEETAGIIDIQGTQGGSAVDIIGAYNGEKQ